MTLADRVYLSSLHFSYCGKRLNSSSALSMCTIFLDEKGATNILVLSIFRQLLSSILKNVIQLVVYDIFDTFWWFFKNTEMWTLQKVNQMCQKSEISIALFGSKLTLCCALFPLQNLHTVYVLHCTPLCAFSQRKSDLYFSFLLLTEFRCAYIWSFQIC